jgi:hypothetical protein
VIIDSPLNYMEPWKHLSQAAPGKVIAAAAGLEPGFKDLLKRVKIEPRSAPPKYREVLSPQQKSKGTKDVGTD